MTEFDTKQTRLQALLTQHHLDALLLRRVSSFAWATCGGDSHINTADSHGIASLLITPTGRYLITNNIEATRLEREEKLGEQEWEFRVTPWYESLEVIAELTRGLKWGADGAYPGAADLSGELARLRAALTPEEGDRFSVLGRQCAEAMDSAARAIQPGQTEFQIAGLLAQSAESRGVQAIVILIATDERIFDYRHPLPTAKKLERYAMLVLCGRRHGLVCSVTRFVHIGRLPDDLRRRAEAIAHIDAVFIHATRPGHWLGEIFQRAAAAYAERGFPDEWTQHHQGGLAGYEPREITATPDSSDRVISGQAYAWNPSITGTKSEDTILIGETGNQVLTAIPNWPTLAVSVDGHTLERPAILEVT
jgi:antitoxin VapB